MRILRDPLLGVFGGRILNIHPSLLPKYSGLRAIERAIEAGDHASGYTIHLVDGGVDSGEILKQEEVPILSGDSPEHLQQRIQAVEHVAYPEVIAEQLAKLA
jgi:phosphoribosylglycinamide formyltransferase-1